MLLAVVEDYDGGELLNNICWVRLMKFLLLMREEGLTGEWREGGGNVTFDPLSFSLCLRSFDHLHLKKLLPYYLLLFTLLIILILPTCRHIHT